MLALDEADRILDLGFRDQLTSILTYLPSKDSYQTVLFSATQTKSVKDLARLSLHQPECVAARLLLLLLLLLLNVVAVAVLKSGAPIACFIVFPSYKDWQVMSAALML